jgi:glucosamine--fructose-6-phosphate aminotransferase (isomerizing)
LKEVEKMCGIIGFAGEEPAVPVLLDGLERLEYRGYDSAGIAVFENGKVRVVKARGRLSALREKISESKPLKGTVGIGHTRWATHGAPSDINAHPHQSSTGLFTVVHNGIIENYSRLKEELIADGYSFASETDTEVIAHLLEKNYKGNPIETMVRALSILEGSYSIGVLCADFPDKLFCTRHSSPLLAGIGKNSCLIASDIAAMLQYSSEIYRLEEGELAVLTKDSIAFYNAEGSTIKKERIVVDLSPDAVEKGGYEHFMLKEIMEQPEALRNTLLQFLGENRKITLGDVPLPRAELEKIDRVFIVACGSAYHAGVVGKYVFEEMARIPVEVDIASEFRYRRPILNEKTLVIIISQSGETADTLAALREAKNSGAKILSIVNVPGSSIARESGFVLPTRAGVEIAVATTKAYSSQLAVLYVIAAYFAQELKTVSDEELRDFIFHLAALPETVSYALETATQVEELAQFYAKQEDAYYIGRNLDYAAAMEASLKLKEISYVHSEAYAAGELKHGTISLIEEKTLVVALCCCERLLPKTAANIKEVKARGAQILCVASQGNTMELEADRTITVPRTHPLLMPSVEIIPMQLFSYYVAKCRKCDIDKPRNLAKSVTVE